MNLRTAAVAGSFYAKDHDQLDEQIRNCFIHERGPGDLPISRRKGHLKATIIPHAGYQFSGPCAAWAYKDLAEAEFPDTYLIIGTNHSAYPHNATLFADWQTPYGVVKTDMHLADQLVKKKIAQNAPEAHLHEHSIEVQLPFLQFISRDRLPDLRVTALLLAPDVAVKDIALDLQELLLDLDKKVTVIVSSDFTHYGPNYHFLPFEENVPKQMQDMDMGAIRLIKELNGEGFFDYVRNTGATICGYLPIAALLEIFPKSQVELHQYYASGHVTDDWRNSVGYASFTFR